MCLNRAWSKNREEAILLVCKVVVPTTPFLFTRGKSYKIEESVRIIRIHVDLSKYSDEKRGKCISEVVNPFSI